MLMYPHLIFDSKGVAKSNKFESGEERRIITDWLSSIDFSNQQNDFINRHQEGTGQWLLNSEDFKNWVDEQGQTLFCHGIPGAGKTIITSIVIENLCNKFQVNDVGIAFIYCSYKNEQEQKFDKLMLSLLKQLVQQRHDLPLEIQPLYQRHITRGTRPSIKEVTEVLRSVMTCYSRVFIIVDALDESTKTDREQLLEELFRFQSQVQVNIFATSRSLPEIAIHFNINESLEIRASEEDVRRYLENHTWRFPRFVLQNPDLQKDIISQIVNVVDGM